MGAEVSSNAGYTAKQAADFERKYREMYGEDLSRDDLLERYRMEKLKADQKHREEQAREFQKQQRDRSEDRYHSRRHHRSGSRERDDRYSSRRRQQDNFDIIRSTYERSRRNDRRYYDTVHHSSTRHDTHRRNDNGRNRRRSSRDRSRRSSSHSSTKENRSERRQDRGRSKKMSSSRGRRSPSTEGEMRGRRSPSSPSDRHRSSRDKKREEGRDAHSTRHKSSRKKRNNSQSSDEDRHKRESKKETEAKKKHRTCEKESKAAVIKHKKKKNAKAQHYQSAPDLTESDRQYGKGPWQRTHMFFDDYSHRPQSWMQELAQGQSAPAPTPVMERQIIYSVPHDSSQLVDGLGYPLRERSPGFEAVPYETYLMPRSARPLSLDISHQHSDGFSSMQSQHTNVKLPAGAAPALGPQSPGGNLASRTAGIIIPERGYEVQAHVPAMSTSASLPAQYRNGPSSMPPTCKTPPQYKSSTLPRSHAPTPKPRTKSPTKDVKALPGDSTKNPKSPKQGKEHKSKITAISAREDFESLLASDYDMSKMKMPGGGFSEEFPPSFVGNYRPNQEIFVDDVIFRKHPDVKEDSGSLTDSDVVTDEEHVLTLGGELSPNSVGYSSGYDLEIPEGFCFDSEVEKSSTKGKKQSKGAVKKKQSPRKSRQHEPAISKRAARPLSNEILPQSQRQPTTAESKPLVLGAVQPVSRPNEKKVSGGRRERRSRNRSSSPERLEKILQSEVQKKAKNRETQHPSNDGHYGKVNTASRKKPQKQESFNIDVGEKEMRRKKSAGSGKKRRGESNKPPIYFLKPISSQEVFIEDSTRSETDNLTTRSETDYSQTPESSAASSTSNNARSVPSFSKYSATSESEQSETSEVESSVHNIQRNSKLYASRRNRESTVTSSVTSIESEKPASAQPTSMILGVSEFIQASSYTGKGGKVFCLTKSKHDSSVFSKDHVSYHEGYDDRGHHVHENGRLNSEYKKFDAHEVGKWVLDCYAHDQKLTTKKSISQDLPSPREHEDDLTVQHSHGQLTKQQAVEYEGSFQIESEGSSVSKESAPSKVVSLTQEALSKHEAHPGFHRSESREVEESGTELSVDMNSDLDVFRKELIKTKRRIQQAAKEDPEPKWKLDEYKANLKRRNNSPSSNVVLAEVCAVNDEAFVPLSNITSKEIQPQPSESSHVSSVPPKQNESTDDTSSESTLSWETDDEPSKESTAPPISQADPVIPPKSQNIPQLKRPVSLQKSGSQHDGLNNKNFAWARNVQPSSEIKTAGDDWRIINVPKRQPNNTIRKKDVNDNLQQHPFIPRTEILKHSVDTALGIKSSNPHPLEKDRDDTQPSKARSFSVNSNSTTCSSQVANPFNKMDENEIESLVGKIPGRKTLEKSESEEDDILAKLEKSRMQTKRESLEERTARILGIYRKTSDDDEDESDDSSVHTQKEAPSLPLPAPTTSSNDRKIDMNTYMNNLLTGVTDVSPASRKKFFLGDMVKDQQQVTSPLATTSLSSKPTAGLDKSMEDMKKTRKNETSESSSSDGESSEGTSVTGSFSVNVSDSIVEANAVHKVQLKMKNDGQINLSNQYRIPDEAGSKRRGATSPKGGMLLSYGKNIYAESPGFHSHQRSYDSTESDEVEVGSSDKVKQKTVNPRQVQDSPVPISPSSPPLTEKEIDIVNELARSHTRTASHDSIGASVNGAAKAPTDVPPVNSGRSSPASSSSSRSRSWSPNREIARGKIAKSIGFTLPAENKPTGSSGAAQQPLAFSTDEYDIKILSVDKKRASPNHKVSEKGSPPLEGDKDSIENVMESIGLDPNEAWLLSV